MPVCQSNGGSLLRMRKASVLGIGVSDIVHHAHTLRVVGKMVVFRAGFKIFLLIVLIAALTESSQENYADGESLSRAFASPLNVDPKVDCAIKELAWEYAKKLLPRVSLLL